MYFPTVELTQLRREESKTTPLAAALSMGQNTPQNARETQAAQAPADSYTIF